MTLRLGVFVSACAALVGVSSIAHSQQPYPQQPLPPPQAQPYPPQPYQPPPPQPYPPQQQQPYPPQQQQPYPPQQQQPYPPQQQQPYPPQQQPYPPQQQPYPPQQQPYPPQQQPYQPYPQQQQPLPPPQPQPGQPPAPGQPAQPQTRGSGEMFYLYGTSIAYGVGTGIWIDALATPRGGNVDPGIAIIAPIAFGAAMPVGVYFLDKNVTLHYGTPAAISTGLILGAVEGLAISGAQWQATEARGHDWSFTGYSTITFATSTIGGFGGYAFGEWARIDPRAMAFVGSGAAWGGITGSLMGIGIASDAGDGASAGGLIGYNGGIAATGALSFLWTPTWTALKWMWIGYGLGTAAGSIVYPFYLADSNAKQDIHHGLIANALGGLAGVGLAGALASGSVDTAEKSIINELPFQLAVAPAKGGATLQAAGTW